jgi:predicted PurR-regulated permease PerM
MSDHWIEQSTRNPYIRLIALLGGLVLLGVIVYSLRGVLTPVFVAFLIAYLLDPVVDRFEARGVNRTLAIVILMIVLFIVVGLMLVLIGLAVGELIDAIKDLPGWLEATIHEWRSTWQQQPAVIWVTQTFGIDLVSVDTDGAIEAVRSLRERLVGLIPNLVGPARAILTHALSGTVTLFAWIANIVLVPLIAFYLLRDFDTIVARVRDLVPRHFRDEVTTIFKEIDLSIAAFVRGQLLVMIILGMLYGLGLTVFQVKMGFGIGLLAGLLCIVPYLGFFIGMGLAVIMSLMGGDAIWLNLIGTVVTFGVVQILEGTVITPKIVGDKVGLHPVWVIVSLMVGAHALGVLGMLLAVPAAAVIKILLKRAIVRYKASRLFDRERTPNAVADAVADETTEPPSLPSAGDEEGTEDAEHEAAEPEAEPEHEHDAVEPEAPAEKAAPAAQKAPIMNAEHDEDWARRTGRIRPSGAGTVKESPKDSTATLPNHPVGPQLQQVIDDAKARDRASAPPSEKAEPGTLHGVPARKHEDEE